MQWTGVLNNYTEEDIEFFSHLDLPELVIGKEVGEEGTPHIHLYLHLESKKRLKQMKELHPRVHWEHVRSRQKCIAYCSKGEVVVKRLRKTECRELDAAIECMHRRGLLKCAEEFPYQFVLHQRGLQALQYATIAATKRPVPVVSWYWGPTGTGKSRKAREDCEPDLIYTQFGPNARGASMWWDGYYGQKRVIMDDYRPWWCPFSFLLALLDRYDMQVQVKGGFVNFIPEEIIITTPKPPEETFTGEYRTPEDIQQVRRRLSHVVQFVDLGSGR